MAKKFALGDTFDSIFDEVDSFEAGSGGLQTLKIGEIEPNRDQPRKDFDPEKLEVLADSIAQHGVITPIVVRLIENNSYQIVAGERRWRAARMAGLSEVPVRIMELNDSQTMQIALIENLQREDLNPVEEAVGYSELIESYGMTQDELAKIVGKARSSVANSLRLLTLPDEVLELVKQNRLSKGHCKAVMSVQPQSSERMIELANRAADEELSVRETEKLAKQLPVKRKPLQRSKKPFFLETELALGEALNTAVRIIDGKKKKTLCIDFTDEEELKNIVNNFK
ncbi:MAG: ParB/RepB/Spo0J family partition protein [Oscillospiraceae bacterium]|nr:ParB/RepB/Spo0J family partition protein [Oscillospiraceae bacterium]